MANRRGKSRSNDRFYFLELQNSLHMVTAAMKLRCLLPGRKAMTNPGSILKSKDIILWTMVPYNQSYGFSSSHVWMWELDHKEGWVLKNWWFWIVMLEMTIEGTLDCKEIKLVNPKENQPWIFIEVLIRKLKLQYFSQLMQRADSLKNTLKLVKTEGKRGRQWQRMRWLDSITDSIWANSRRQWRMGSLICCSPWGYIESDTT